MSKGLEALEKLLSWFDDEHIGLDNTIKESQEYKTIKKELKALEIIRKIIKYDVEVNGNEIFEEFEPNEVITKEEFDLLKEVLL